MTRPEGLSRGKQNRGSLLTAVSAAPISQIEGALFQFDSNTQHFASSRTFRVTPPKTHSFNRLWP